MFSTMNERSRWALALLLALASNALLLIVILLQISGLFFLSGIWGNGHPNDCGETVIGEPRQYQGGSQAQRSVPNPGNHVIAQLNSAWNSFIKSQVGISSADKAFISQWLVHFFQEEAAKRSMSVFQNWNPDLSEILLDDRFEEKLFDASTQRFESISNLRDPVSSSPLHLQRCLRDFVEFVKSNEHVNPDTFLSSRKNEPPFSYNSPNENIEDVISSSKFQTYFKQIKTWRNIMLKKLFDSTSVNKNYFSEDLWMKVMNGTYSENHERNSDDVSNSHPDHAFAYGDDTSRDRQRRDDGAAIQRDSSRRSDVPIEQMYPMEEDTMLEEIFSSLTKDEVDQFSDSMKKTLLPAMIHFEVMVIRDLEFLHTTMISHDLRLENLEKIYLSRGTSSAVEPQSDTMDNKTSEEDLNQIIEENFIPVNATNPKILQVVDAEGSGEDELKVLSSSTTTTTPITTSTTTTTTTTTNPDVYYLYRSLQEMEQKVSALENYNIMIDSELLRTRSEVIKMDDKVAELDRRYRNLQIRTSLHTYRVTELEVFMGKTEVSVHTALDSFSRVKQRLDVFKDRLSSNKNDIHAMQVQFGRQNQITGELRAADSYKAHDINELRTSLLGVEERLNSLYRVLDENVDMVRSDLRSMLDRLCYANGLAC